MKKPKYNIKFLEIFSYFLEYLQNIQDSPQIRSHWIPAIGEFDELLHRWITTRGTLDTIKRIKAIRLHVTRYVCGNPLHQSAHPSLSINNEGLPKYRFIQVLINGDKWDLRILFTLLRVSRAMSYIGSPDLSSITDSFTGQISDELIRDVKYVCETWEGKIPKPLWKEFHRSTKAGPNALAMISSIQELFVLFRDPILVGSLIELGASELVTKAQHLVDFSIDKWIDTFKLKRPKEDTLIRKLSIINDKEAKTRIIAIGDYWTQSALKPLHDRIFSYLRRIKTDMTFNQLQSRSVLPDQGPYYSLDLSSATDRFPVEIQKVILGEMIGKDYSEAWTRVVADYEFYVPWENRRVKYSVGQPMGLYSSWSVFALSHHIIVQVSALRVGKYPFKEYCLLGDDIVIADSLVALSYQKIIGDLGVTISEQKSHVSQDTYEFAKRWYKDKVEITGFPIESLLESRKWFLLANEMTNGLSRWDLDPLKSAPAAYSSFLKRLLRIHSEVALRLTRKTWKFLLLQKLIHGHDSPDLPLSWVVSNFIPIGCSTNVEELRILALQLLAEAKARVLEEGLRKVKDSSDKFLRTAKEYLASYEGSNAATALKSLPVVDVAIKQHSQLVASIEDIRSYQGNFSDKELLFTKEAYLGFDPLRLWNARTSEVIQASNATLVNKFASVAKDYHSLIGVILSTDGDEHQDRALVRKVLGPRALTPVLPGYPLVAGKPQDE